MHKFVARIWRWIDANVVKVTLTTITLTIVILVLWPMSVIFVPAGHVGVLWSRFFGGTIVDHVFPEGTHLILPWDIMTIYDARIQLVQQSYDVLTADGLNSSVNITFRYRIDETAVGQLHKLVGPDYRETLLIADVGAQARTVFARYQPEVAFTEKRVEIERAIETAVDRHLIERFNPTGLQSVRFIILEDVLISGVRFPPPVAEAIERKATEYNRAEQYKFTLEAEREEAERKQIEAQGIREFQDTIKDGLTDNYLRWRGIEATLQLAQSQNSKVVVIGSGPNGLPIILGSDAGPTQLGPVSKPNPPLSPIPEVRERPSDAASRPPAPAVRGDANATPKAVPGAAPNAPSVSAQPSAPLSGPAPVPATPPVPAAEPAH